MGLAVVGTVQILGLYCRRLYICTVTAYTFRTLLKKAGSVIVETVLGFPFLCSALSNISKPVCHNVGFDLRIPSGLHTFCTRCDLHQHQASPSSKTFRQSGQTLSTKPPYATAFHGGGRRFLQPVDLGGSQGETGNAKAFETFYQWFFP